jgi:hypothetical protein
MTIECIVSSNANLLPYIDYLVNLGANRQLFIRNDVADEVVRLLGVKEKTDFKKYPVGGY